MTRGEALRWWLFKKLSALGWWICPEPHKSNLQSVMPTWDEIPPVDATIKALEARDG